MNRKGIASVGILITMFFITLIAFIGMSYTTNLKKTNLNTFKIRENRLIGENFVTYYQIFASEKIKQEYMSFPEKNKDKINFEDMNIELLNLIYGSLTGKWYYEFKSAMENENSKAYFGYNIYNIQITKQYYNVTKNTYIDYRGKIRNDDFRVILKMILIGDNGERRQLDTMIYFDIPKYTKDNEEQWLKGEEISYSKEEFNTDKITKVGDTVVF
ncbi:MAG: hypothetical protein ACRDA4_06350 [Filifactoraceae bacterium]